MQVNPEVWGEFQKGFIGDDMNGAIVLFAAVGIFVTVMLTISLLISIAAVLRRQDFVRVVSGFYQGYSGRVLDKRWLVMYGINIGGERKYIARWHLRKSQTRLSDKLRERLIEKDR